MIIYVDFYSNTTIHLFHFLGVRRENKGRNLVYASMARKTADSHH